MVKNMFLCKYQISKLFLVEFYNQDVASEKIDSGDNSFKYKR